VAKIGRNEPCPCGSGRKYKRCCAELERLAPVIEEIVGLPALFPRLRPVGSEFDAWADSFAAGEFEVALIDDGIRRLSPDERERIERAHAEEFPAVWRSLCAEAGDEELARRALIAGAVVAAIGERLPPDPERVDVLEWRARDQSDFADTLAIVLDCRDLWSLHESIQADEAAQAISEELDDDVYETVWNAVVALQAEQLAGDWHHGRLALLVRRLRARLPLEDAPLASAALQEACAAFERDPEVRARLSAYLLGDSLSWETVASSAAA
jgi:hypothetical protein